MNMFNRSSRPQSAASTHSTNEILVEEEQPAHIEVETIDENEAIAENWDNDPAYKFTESHPLGSILLKIVQDNTKLAEKSKLKSMVTNINDLCESFYNGINMERTKVNTVLNNTVAGVEKSLLDKELNSHTINAAISPPQSFSPFPIITTSQKLTDVLKIFPKAGKFSGNLQRDGQFSVIEFLNALTTAQNQCNLSESEFLDRMLASTTGLAHDLVFDWKVNGDNCSTIYHSLIVNFDNRMSAEEAKQRLTSFIVTRNSTLAKAESQIQLWVARAASLLPPGDSRTAYRDMEGCNTLIRALPQYSSLQAANLYQNYTARLQRACTMQELFRGLDQYRGMIDKDIKLNGATIISGYSNRRNMARNQNPIQMRSQKFNNLSAFNTFVAPPSPEPRYAQPSRQINGQIREQRSTARVNNNSLTRNNSRNSSNNKWNYAGSSSQRNEQTPGAAYNRGQRFNKSFGGPVRSFRNNNYTGPRNQDERKLCTLCGQKHATEDCKNMKDNTGKTLTIIPTYGFCNNCPQWVKPRLRHPEVICPYRVGGPFYRKNQRG